MKKYLVIVLCLAATAFGIDKKYRRPQVNTVGLVAHYKLWASPMSWPAPGVDGKVFDYSLSGFVGTLVDTSDPNNLLPAYPGFVFDGTNDYINASALSGSITPTGSYSLSAWALTSDTGQQAIFALGNSGDNNPFVLLDIGLATAGATRFGARDDAGTSGQASYSGGYNDGTWHHYVGVKSGTSFKIYVDGALVNTGTPATISTTTLDTGAIGLLRRTTDTLDFNGTIGGIMIFNTAKTAIEVKSIYETTRWRYQK